MKSTKGLWKQKKIAAVAGAAMAVSAFSAAATAAGETASSGTPYTAEGKYDVTVEHVLVNQVYGGSDDGAASHSFIELYNPCDAAVDLAGWELLYQSSADGGQTSWQELTPTGTIPANG